MNDTSVDLDPDWGSVPAPASNRWGEEIPDLSDFFYVSAAPTDVKTLHEETITAATGEWWNFGPLEYWVAGVDVDAANELADKYCSPQGYPGGDVQRRLFGIRTHGQVPPGNGR